MTTSLSYLRWSGIAAILGGLLFTLRAATFALTHGTQSSARHALLFGLTSTQYAQMLQVPMSLCFLVGVIGINTLQASRAKRFGKIGFVISVAGYALGVISWILQVWIVDPDKYFFSTSVQGGFILSLVALLLQTVGMSLFGFAIWRTWAFPRWNALPISIGLLTLLTVLFRELFIFDRSDGSLDWSLAYIVLSTPYSLGWVVLGYLLWSHTETAKTLGLQTAA